MLQSTIGMLLPLLRSMRAESAEAVRFAGEHGMRRTACSVQLYSFLFRATHSPLAWHVAAAALALYASGIAMSWWHLGKAYSRS